MKRLCLPLLLTLCLLLSGCGAKPAEEGFSRFSDALNARNDLSFTASLQAEYSDRSMDFRLAYTEDESGCLVTVLEPELIRGVSARISSGSTCLEYSSLVLDTGPLDAYGLSPMSALPVLVSALRGAHVESAWQEGEQAVLSLIPDDHMSVTVRFDEGFERPLTAELASDGRVTVYCEFEDWS